MQIMVQRWNLQKPKIFTGPLIKKLFRPRWWLIFKRPFVFTSCTSIYGNIIYYIGRYTEATIPCPYEETVLHGKISPFVRDPQGNLLLCSCLPRYLANKGLAKGWRPCSISKAFLRNQSTLALAETSLCIYFLYNFMRTIYCKIKQKNVVKDFNTTFCFLRQFS